MPIEHEHRLTEVEDRAKANTRRIEAVEKRQDDQEKLISTVAVLANEQKTIKTDVQEIKGEVKRITAKPAERWESLVEKVVWAILAAVIAYGLAKFGL